jgi:cytosine/adenosine deaminase-related metal-dependent hydrolase
MDARTLSARWVFPVAGPPLPDGTVTVRGDRIEAVDPAGVRTPDERLGNVAIIPGLVNAHTHLDLSGARGRVPPTDPDHFTDWLRGVIAFRRSRTEADALADIRTGLAECLAAGTTLIGDIASDGRSWDALAGAKVRGVVYLEMIGLTAERAELARHTAQEWFHSTTNTSTTRKALSPHAPYSVRSSLFDFATGPGDLRMAFHFAESPAEMELLNHRRGPFVEFLSGLGLWDPGALKKRPEKYVISSRGAGYPVFVHCNYLPSDWWKYMGGGGHTVVYCPRTHAAFGHPRHPVAEFLARGVRVCVGTDSLASNPDLDVLAELRFLRNQRPDLPGNTLLWMGTLAGAEALGWADESGSLEAGKSADLVAVPLPDRDAADPHDLLLAPDAPVSGRRTLFRGEWR